jgi:hypothetical protein
MILSIGQQLPDSHGAHYTVTAVRRKSALSVLYDAEKAFLNYRYRERQFYAAGSDEHLPVLLRCPCYAEHDQQTADALRELLHFEATQVLTLRGARWFPEPLDLLSLTRHERGRPAPPLHEGSQPTPPLTKGGQGGVRASNDPRLPSGPSEPLPSGRLCVLAMVRPHGDTLPRWCASSSDDDVVARMHFAREALELLALLHGEGCLLGGFDPHDFLVDSQGRLYYLGTDRVVRESRMPRLRRFFPPERFFAPWAAPEATDVQGWLDVRSDFYSWAALTSWLLVGRSAVPQQNVAGSTAECATQVDPVLDPGAMDRARMEHALGLVARDAPLLLDPAGRRAATAVDRWSVYRPVSILSRIAGRPRLRGSNGHWTARRRRHRPSAVLGASSSDRDPLRLLRLVSIRLASGIAGFAGMQPEQCELLQVQLPVHGRLTTH